MGLMRSWRWLVKVLGLETGMAGVNEGGGNGVVSADEI